MHRRYRTQLSGKGWRAFGGEDDSSPATPLGARRRIAAAREIFLGARQLPIFQQQQTTQKNKAHEPDRTSDTKERFARIGQLLAKGVTLMLMREAEAKQQAEAQASVEIQLPMASDSVAGFDEDHHRILEFLHRVGKASPREGQDGLEFSKATLFRRLREFQTAGLVLRSGMSTAVHYRIVPPAKRSAKQRYASTESTPTPHLGHGSDPK